MNDTKNSLITAYFDAVTKRNALNNGTLTEAETAGYWLWEAPHDPWGEFTRMLKRNSILLSENHFYSKVNEYLREVS